MPKYKLKVVKTLDYKRPEIEKGYTDQTLHIDISKADIAIKPVEQKTKDLFIGGKGYDLWLLWNAVQADTYHHRAATSTAGVRASYACDCE